MELKLICFDCLTYVDTQPGQDKTPATTMLNGTVLCDRHARDRARAAEKAPDPFSL